MLINLLALIVKFYEIVDIGLYWLVWCLLCVDNVRQYIVYIEPTSRHDALMTTTCSDNDSTFRLNLARLQANSGYIFQLHFDVWLGMSCLKVGP